MISPQADIPPSLDFLRMRDELLQIMYWMLGEGLGSQPTAAQIEAFLGVETPVIATALERMAMDGFVTEVGVGAFQLTDTGLHEGRRSFNDEFAGLTQQAHGECSPDCTFCHSPDGDPSACPSKSVSHAAAG